MQSMNYYVLTAINIEMVLAWNISKTFLNGIRFFFEIY